MVVEMFGVHFELVFFTNVSINFPEAKLIGCLFHFKQAIRRKMKKLKFPDNKVDYAMRKGVLIYNCHSCLIFENGHKFCGENASNSYC